MRYFAHCKSKDEMTEPCLDLAGNQNDSGGIAVAADLILGGYLDV